MLTVIFLFSALLHIVFLALGIRLWRKNRSIYTAIILAVIAGLAYDNFIIGIGSFVGEGDLLRQLNFVRFVVHGVVTPLMIMFGWGDGGKIRSGLGEQTGRILGVCRVDNLNDGVGYLHRDCDLKFIPNIGGRDSTIQTF